MIKTIAYITDIHLDEAFPIDQGVDPRENWKRILEDVHKRGINTIIFGGDIGEPSAHEWFFTSLKDYTIDITLGNHDQFVEVTKSFTTDLPKGANEWYYTYEDESFKYLFLDSSIDTISATQWLWLVKELSTPKHLLLFIHHPILPIDTAADTAYPLKGRERIKQALQERTAYTTIFCGHYHMSDEQSTGLIKQYVTPASSFQLVKERKEIEIDTSTFGYRLIHMADQQITTEVIWFPTTLPH